MCPDPLYLVILEVVEEHRAPNVIVGELEECLPDVRHWDLRGKVKGWIGQILQVQQSAIQGTWAPLVSMCWPWSATSCGK